MKMVEISRACRGVKRGDGHDRTVLVDKAIATVKKKNLLEGAILVIVICSVSVLGNMVLPSSRRR